MKPSSILKLVIVAGVCVLVVAVYFLWAWAFQETWNSIALVYWSAAPILTYKQAMLTLALKLLLGIGLHMPSFNPKKKDN